MRLHRSLWLCSTFQFIDSLPLSHLTWSPMLLLCDGLLALFFACVVMVQRIIKQLTMIPLTILVTIYLAGRPSSRHIFSTPPAKIIVFFHKYPLLPSSPLARSLVTAQGRLLQTISFHVRDDTRRLTTTGRWERS